jgi:large subunit ribosomal protein L18
VKQINRKSLRHQRVRKKVRGTTERPRLCVFRSLDHIYAQVIDDDTGRTLVSASSLQIIDQAKDKTKTQVAELVGVLVAKNAIASQVTKVVFDRGGYQFHGRVKALAEAARTAGLEF